MPMNARVFVVLLYLKTLLHSAAETQIGALPSLSFDDLASASHSWQRRIVKAFRTVGALVVNDVPGLAEFEELALHGISRCLESSVSEKNAARSSFPDGSTRHTFAISSDAAGVDGQLPSWVIENCGDPIPAITSLRDISRQVVERIAQSCDMLADRRGPSLMPMVAAGEHLEHFHRYHPPAGRKSIASFVGVEEPTLHMHTDVGLLLAMSGGLQIGLDTSGADAREPLLELQLSSGRVVAVRVPKGAMLLLVGQGLADWLPGLGFRAAPHALRMSAMHSLASARAWYGRMVLPPKDFIVGRGVTFGDWMGRAQALFNRSSEDDDSVGDEDGQLGCFSHSAFQRRLRDLSATCSSGQIFCWLQCMSVASLPCGEDAQCMESGSEKVCDGHGDDHSCQPMCPAQDVALVISGAGETRVNGKYAAKNPQQSSHTGTHRMDYKQIGGTAWLQWNSNTKEWVLKDTQYNNANPLYWSSEDVNEPWSIVSWRVSSGAQPPAPLVKDPAGAVTTDASNSDGFCNGIGTDMFMGGFVSLFDEIRKSGPCLIIFFTGWKLDSPGKFVIALIGAILAGIACEGLLAIRSRSSRTKHKANRHRTLAVNVFLYAVHRSLGYLVMLLAMTYSVEMFIAVIIGLSAGYFVFNATQPVTEGETACCSNNFAQGSSSSLKDANFSDIIFSECGGAQFMVEGMTCNACAETVQRSVMEVPDVVRASVNLATGMLRVLFSTKDLETNMALKKSVCQAVEDAGFVAREDVAHDREAV